jgi:hypothetical protein
LAEGWEDGRTAVESLYKAEKEYLEANARDVGVLHTMAAEFGAWGKEIQRWIMDEEEEMRKERDDSCS